jgi:hypothetical protein
LIFAISSGFKQKPKAVEQKASVSGLAAIRAGTQAFVAAFNCRDAKTVAALWAESGDYTDETGRSLESRQYVCRANRPLEHGKARSLARNAESHRLEWIPIRGRSSDRIWKDVEWHGSRMG